MEMTFSHAPNQRVTLTDLDPDNYYRDPTPFLAQNKVVTTLRRKTAPHPTSGHYSYREPTHRVARYQDAQFGYTGRRKGDKELLASLIQVAA